MIYSFLLVIADFITLLVAFTAAYFVRVQIDTRPLVSDISFISFFKVFLILIPFWLMIQAFVGLYNKDVYESRLSELARLLLASFMGILLIVGYDFIRDETIFPARLVPVYAFAGSFILLAIERNIMWIFRKHMFRYGYGVRSVMLIGSSEATLSLAKVLAQSEYSGYDVKAAIANKTSLPKEFEGQQFTNITAGLESAEKLGINTIIQTTFYDQESKNKQISDFARNHHVAYRFIPTQNELYTGKNSVELFHEYPLIAVHQTPLMGWGRVVKRLMDIFLSLFGLIVLSPIILVVMLIVAIFDFGPLFFTQRRMTRWGGEFSAIKFRTMKRKYSGRDPAEVFMELGRPELTKEFTENQNKLDNDPRISSVGRVLRASSLDELPQLINVIKGDMSLVGPRAIPKTEAERNLREKVPLILSVKTGITGLAQVSGRSDLSLDERIRLDTYYVQNWSIWLDIKIILKTFVVVLTNRGAQ